MANPISFTDFLFGCWHKRLTFPFSRTKPVALTVALGQMETYVVCLDCGKEFNYDWKRMKLVGGKRDYASPGGRKAA